MVTCYGAEGTFRYLLLLLSYYEYEGASKDTYEGTRDHAKIVWGAVWLKSRAIEGDMVAFARSTRHACSRRCGASTPDSLAKVGRLETPGGDCLGTHACFRVRIGLVFALAGDTCARCELRSLGSKPMVARARAAAMNRSYRGFWSIGSICVHVLPGIGGGYRRQPA